MKKLIALLLALMMVLVCVSALAADGDPQVGDGNGEKVMYQFNADGIVTLTKSYTKQGDTNAVIPADVLKFGIEGDHVENATNNNMDIPAATIADVTVNEGDEKATISIVLPTYTTVGEYFYNITETDTGVAGVTYLGDTIVMKVQVFWNPDTKALDRYVTFRIGSQKIDGFTNTYEAGTLTVSKTVEGNMGDTNKEWNFTVVFSAPEGDTVMGDITTSATGDATAPTTIAAGDDGWSTTKTSTFKLVSGQSVKFSNIPQGVSYTVSETEAGLNGYVTKVGDTELKKSTDTVSGEIAAHEDDTVAVKNTKNVDIDTGVTLDSTVYMMIMALALAGFVVLKIRRREEN